MYTWLLEILTQQPVLAPAIFIILRLLAIIIPPIPGFVIDLPGILVFGWLKAFLYSEIGSMLGALVAFWLARRFREPLVGRFVSLQKLKKWEQTLSERQKFWSLVVIRLPTNPAFDYISYAAGLTTIKPARFFWASLLGSLPTSFLLFYLGGVSLKLGLFYGILFVAALFILWLIFQRRLGKPD